MIDTKNSKKEKLCQSNHNAKKADRDFTLYLPKNQKMYLSNSSKKNKIARTIF